MKLTVMTMGMVKVEGSSLAEEIEMRNKLQALGVPCTPIEFEGSVADCLDYVMGKSESELDEVADEDEDNGVYVLTDEDGQELEIEIDEVIDYIDEHSSQKLEDLDRLEIEEAVENYLWNKPEITEDDFYYLTEMGQVEELADKVCDRL